MLTIMILLIVLSLIQGLQLLNVVIIVILGAAYTLYTLRNSHPTSMEITEKGLRIKEAVYPRDELNGFVIELTRTTHNPHNIVIIKNNNLHLIHTIIDHDSVHDFITTLSDIIPMLSSFDQTFSEKLMRRLMV